MTPALLLCLYLGKDTEAPPAPPKTNLVIYLWDYSEGRDPEAVKHLPRFRNSRLVREALTANYPHTDLAYAQERLRAAANVRIIDDYRAVDSLPCPCYGFTTREAAVEIGNYWAVDEHGTRGPPYHDCVSMCWHLAYLAELYRESQDSGCVRFCQETASSQRQVGDRTETVDHEYTIFRPTIQPYPPIRFEPDEECVTKIKTVQRVGDVVVHTEEREYSEHRIGDTDSLLFYTQMDCGSNLLMPRIIERLAIYYDADFFEPGMDYIIPLVKRGTIQARCTGREGYTVTFSAEGAMVVVDLTKSQATITRANNGRPQFGIPGTWLKAVETNRRITRSSPL